MVDHYYPHVLLPQGVLSPHNTADAIRRLFDIVYAILDTGSVSGSDATIQVGSHIDRLNSNPTGLPLGSFFFETDRTVLYQVTSVVGANVWTYVAGVMTATGATRPSGLGTDDAGFRFLATETAVHSRWSGSAWIEEIEVTDASTATALILLNMIHRSSGTPGAGFGASLRYQLENAAHALKDAGIVSVVWTDATAASEDADVIVKNMVAGASTETLRVLNTGILQFTIGTKAGRLTHANTATRTYTFADADGNVTYQTAGLTNNNFLLGGGGALIKDAGFSIVPTASGGVSQTAWTTFVPTYSSDLGNAATTFTGTPTTVEAKYKLVGKVAHVSISFTGTLNAVTPQFLAATLPAGLNISGANTQAPAIVANLGVLETGIITTSTGTPGSLVFYRPNLALWTVSSAVDCRCSFTFEIL